MLSWHQGIVRVECPGKISEKKFGDVRKKCGDFPGKANVDGTAGNGLLERLWSAARSRLRDDRKVMGLLFENGNFPLGRLSEEYMSGVVGELPGGCPGECPGVFFGENYKFSGGIYPETRYDKKYPRVNVQSLVNT